VDAKPAEKGRNFENQTPHKTVAIQFINFGTETVQLMIES